MPHFTSLLRLPPSVLTLDRDSPMSDRGFGVFCWVGGGAGLAACCAAFASGASLGSPLGTIAILALVIVVLPVGLKMGIQLKMLTLIGLLYSQGLLLYAAFAFGGFASPAMPWFATIPVFAYYYLRGYARMSVIAAMVVSLVAIGVAPALGVDMTSPIPPDHYNTAYFTSALLAFLYIAYLAKVFARLSSISFRKLSEAKRLSEEKQRQAEWANAAKSQFLANVSHELRTPLNAIIGFSDMVRHQALGPVGNTKYVEYNQDIHDSAVHLLDVINDILDYARVDAGKVEITESRVRAAALAEHAFKQIRQRPEANGILLEKTIESGLPDLYGDERLITQTLINLLVNALKFTNAGGRVGLTAGITDAGEIFFKVSDTGIGIPEDDVIKLGQPFVKSQFTRRKSDEGFGLGLAISKEFMSLHGGTLSITSEVDHGTMVTCTFPQSRTMASDGSAGVRIRLS